MTTKGIEAVFVAPGMDVVTPFQPTHWGTQELAIRDPDGHLWTPWISFYTPDEVAALAESVGFDDIRCVATAELAGPFLAGRSDGLRAASGESVLLART